MNVDELCQKKMAEDEYLKIGCPNVKGVCCGEFRKNLQTRGCDG